MVPWLMHLIFVLGFSAETLIRPGEQSPSFPPHTRHALSTESFRNTEGAAVGK